MAEWFVDVIATAEGIIVVQAPWWVWAISIVVLVIVLWAVTAKIVTAVRRRTMASLERHRLAERRERAARRLVRCDEALQTAEREIDFVVAEHGEAVAAQMSVVIDTCRARLQTGFELLHRMDDAVDPSAQARERQTQRILQLCRRNARELKSWRALLTSGQVATADDDDQVRQRAAALAAAVDERDELLDGIGDEFTPSARDADAGAKAPGKETMLNKALWGLLVGVILGTLFTLGTDASFDVAIAIVIGAGVLCALILMFTDDEPSKT